MHTNRLPAYVVCAALVAGVLAVFGVPLTALVPLAVLLACPLMMIFMMRGMSGMHGHGEDHTGHGCEHDPARHVERPDRKVS